MESETALPIPARPFSVSPPLPAPERAFIIEMGNKERISRNSLPCFACFCFRGVFLTESDDLGCFSLLIRFFGWFEASFISLSPVFSSFKMKNIVKG
jgi:hypothetical protein